MRPKGKVAAKRWPLWAAIAALVAWDLYLSNEIERVRGYTCSYCGTDMRDRERIDYLEGQVAELKERR